MNVAEKLKKCPRGTKLYSSLWGEVELMEVMDDDSKYPIRVSCPEYRDYIMRFDKEGKNYVKHKEPTLFPSKDQRDWSKFEISGKKTNQKNETEKETNRRSKS
jgi:hypothetical protein